MRTDGFMSGLWYAEVRAEFSGTSPENKTIPLSPFYEKNGIERGQLRGSWSLFEKEKHEEILDAGIVNRAKEAELKSLTVAIPTYGRIIRLDNIKALQEKMEGIERDYRAYLDGHEDCKKAGSITVKKKFSPTAAVEESFARLEEYLHRIGPDAEDDRYHGAVWLFIRSKRREMKPFSSQVF